jgi:cobalamin biosynthesis Co2+ chelatase CbiK
MDVSELQDDEEGLTIDEIKEKMAWEYFDYNILGAWMGEGTPVFLTMDPN